MQRTHSVVVAAVAVALSASPALAQQPGIDRADTAWMIASRATASLLPETAHSSARSADSFS